MGSVKRAAFARPGDTVTEFVEWATERESSRLDGQITGWCEGPLAVAYTIEADGLGRTRRLQIGLRAENEDRRLLIVGNGFGQWFTGGVPIPSLNGALDVGLWITPTPELMTLGRLALSFGQEARIPLAWVAGPSLDVVIRYVRYLHVSGDVDGHLYRVGVEDAYGQLAEPADALRLDPEGFLREAGPYRRLP